MAAVKNTNMRVQRRTVLTAVVGLIVIAHATAALANPDPVELAVIDRETGEPLKIWRHHEDDPELNQALGLDASSIR